MDDDSPKPKPNQLESEPPRTLVAVVEDNPDNRLVVRAMLRRHFELVEYEDGFAALDGFAERRPVVVLLDISLPGMDGPEVLRRMRAEEGTSSIPTIALTAHAMAGNREELLELGFDDYVAKPILDPADLIRKIQELAERAGTQDSS